MYDVTYTIDWTDFAAFAAAQEKRIRRRGRVANSLLWALLALIAGFIAWGFATGGALLTLGGAIVLIAGVAILWRRYGVPWLHRRQFALSRLGEGQMRLAVTDSGWRVTHRGTTTTGAWQRLDAVTSNPAHIFIWLGRHNALIVPRRAFPTAGAARAFESYVAARAGGAA